MKTLSKSYKVLDTIGKKVIISIDSDMFDAFCENMEMSQNQTALQNRYISSVASGKGMII